LHFVPFLVVSHRMSSSPPSTDALLPSPQQQGRPILSIDVADKVVLVTGANRGIGRALVEGFLRAEARKVYACVRDVDAYEAADDIGSDARVVPLYMDLTDPNSITEAAAKISQADDNVDIVVNNAGILSRTSPLDEDAVSQLQLEMDVNVYGLMRVAQAFVPILRNKKSTNIDNETSDNGGAAKATKAKAAFVQINSVASMRCAIPEVCTYSASKAAAFSVTQALRRTLERQNILVLSVHPGPIATEMIGAASERLARIAESPSVVADAVLDALQQRKNDIGGSDNNVDSNFMVFPDSNAKKLGKAYCEGSCFGKDYIDGNLTY